MSFFVRDSPFTALLMFLLALYLHCFYLLSHFLLFLILQVGRAFASKVAHLRDPELRRLAKGLPLRAAKAKAPSTTERY